MNNTRHLLAGFVAGLLLSMAPACGPTASCSSTSCPTGCCDENNECQSWSANACGTNGGACVKCAFGQTCNVGTCFANGGSGGSTGGGVGSTGGGTATTGGGTATTGGGSATTGGGTATTGGGTATTGGGTATTGGGTATTGGGTGTTGGGTGTTGGGTGTLQPLAGACTSTNDCQSGLTCKTTRSADGAAVFSGGYCSKSCTASTDCGTGGFCTVSNSVLSLYLDTNICLAGACIVSSANPQSSCRSGYECAGSGEGATGFCLPSPMPIPLGGNADGKIGNACTAASQCQLPPSSQLGFCQPAVGTDGGSTGFTGGYCMANCTYDLRGDFCGPSAACLDVSGGAGTFLACLKTCPAPGGQSTCRSGYTCQAVGGVDGGVCYP